MYVQRAKLRVVVNGDAGDTYTACVGGCSNQTHYNTRAARAHTHAQHLSWGRNTTKLKCPRPREGRVVRGFQRAKCVVKHGPTTKTNGRSSIVVAWEKHTTRARCEREQLAARRRHHDECKMLCSKAGEIRAAPESFFLCCKHGVLRFFPLFCWLCSHKKKRERCDVVGARAHTRRARAFILD